MTLDYNEGGFGLIPSNKINPRSPVLTVSVRQTWIRLQGRHRVHMNAGIHTVKGMGQGQGDG